MPEMTVGELMLILEQYDESKPVRLAMQPRWAMEYTIGEVVETDEAVYLSEHNQVGYLPTEASEALGW